MIAYLDTQVVIHLAHTNTKRISREAQRIMDRAELLIAPIVLVELSILNEIRRIKPTSRDIERKLEQEIGLRVCNLPYSLVADIARDEAWTRDPFDRMIVAHAKANSFAYLISSDGDVTENYPRTVW